MSAPTLHPDLQAIDRTFRVVGLHVPGEVAGHQIDDDTAVVIIDIERCTSTASAVIAAGATTLRVLVKREGDDLEDVVARHAQLGTGNRLVIGGEKNGAAIPGGAFGNSLREVPIELRDADVHFFSTNAGRAVEAVTDLLAPTSGTGVFLMSMANLPLLAAILAERGYTRLVLASGGFYERLSLEDAVAGGRLIRLLGYRESDMDDGALSMAALADRYSDDEELASVLHGNRIGRALHHFGREADIAAAITGKGVEPSLWAAMSRSVGELTWIENTPVFIESNTTHTKEEKCSNTA